MCFTSVVVIAADRCELSDELVSSVISLYSVRCPDELHSTRTQSHTKKFWFFAVSNTAKKYYFI